MQSLSKSGFSLIEVMTAILVVALGIPAVTYMFGTSLRQGSESTNAMIAQFLAESLMSEISERRFIESATFKGNTAFPGDINGYSRAGFTNIGDYNIFKTTWGALSPPRDENGNQLTSFPNFSQYVEVENVAGPSLGPSNMSFSSVGDGTTDFKVVTITIGWNKGHDSIKVSKLFVMP